MEQVAAAWSLAEVDWGAQGSTPEALLTAPALFSPGRVEAWGCACAVPCPILASGGPALHCLWARALGLRLAWLLGLPLCDGGERCQSP